MGDGDREMADGERALGDGRPMAEVGTDADAMRCAGGVGIVRSRGRVTWESGMDSRRIWTVGRARHRASLCLV